ncbi:uncharacterized protein TNCT_514931 [Trichonephila clavata]|uniref:Transposase n=1 Tax=Trichonephila clavata TaxID=2740835 RepID=A0A8X6G184_TRICU|nr:uncharacterized protein TNCT_514931 [Trichonephila clavata]
MVEQNPNLWFQPDGATAHTARKIIELQSEIFGERLIKKKFRFPLVTSFARFNSARLFLWGFLKNKEYVNKPETIRQLKQNIRDEILSLQPETLHSVMENALKRANLCI